MGNERVSTLAIEGFDPVSFFGNKQGRVGKFEFKTQHKGLTYCFFSQENLDKFVKSPDSYLPQFGGKCAFARGLGITANGSPKYFRIVGGKLYFIGNHMVAQVWERLPFLIGTGQSSYKRRLAKGL